MSMPQAAYSAGIDGGGGVLAAAVKGGVQHLSPTHFTAVSLQLGSLLGLPAMAFAVQDWTITPSWQGIAAVLYLGIGCSLLVGWL